MQKILEHYEENRDRFRALDGVVNKAHTAITRGRFTKQAHGLLKSWEDAEDAVQITYTRLLDFVGKGGKIEDKHFDSYFTISLRNAITRVFNHRRGYPESNYEEQIARTLGSDTSEELAQMVWFSDHRTLVDNVIKVEDAIRGFSKKQKDVLSLLLDYQHTVNESAQLLDIPTQDVYNIVRKLKEHVKEVLDVGR